MAVLNDKQVSALKFLASALAVATEVGLLDELIVDLHPDHINGLCDTVDRWVGQAEKADSGKASSSNEDLEVSLDGGKVFFAVAEGVRVVRRNVLVPGEDGRGELHQTITTEGVISDVWVTREEPLDHNIGTRSELASDLIEELVEAGA